MKNTIAVYNFKGRVSKTTSVFNLACAWSRTYRTLVIDCDPQCNLSNVLIPNYEAKQSVYSYLKELVHNQIPAIQPIKIKEKLDLIPGHYSMIELESNSQFIEFGSVILQRFLERVKMNYDVVIIDCPSYFGKTVKSVLNSSDHLLIPATPDVFSLKGAVRLLKYAANMNRLKPINVLGVFLNRYRRNFLFHRKMITAARRVFSKQLIGKTIRNTVRINETADRKMLRNSAESTSNVAADYLELGKLLAERIDRYKKNRMLKLNQANNLQSWIQAS